MPVCETINTLQKEKYSRQSDWTPAYFYLHSSTLTGYVKCYLFTATAHGTSHLDPCVFLSAHAYIPPC